jgi:hypothetical protein
MFNGPNTVTNGLVVAVDAANLKSYQSGSTIWYDKSGNGKNGTLINGPTYSSNNGGVINFDGVNDTVDFGTGDTFFDLPSFTIDIWFQSRGTVPTTGTSPGLFGFTYGIRSSFGAANQISFGISSGSTFQYINATVSSSLRDDGLWYNGVFQASPTTSYLYLNGVLVGSRAATWLGNTIYPTNTWRLGRDNNNPTQFFTGSMASYKMYNRVLTQDEITQNYNATKGRFGL